MNREKKIFGIGATILLIIIAFTPAVNSSSISMNDSTNDTDISLTAGAGGEYYAVLVACAQYEDASSNLPIGEFKLKKLYRGLISNDNWKDENIILLVNNKGDPSNPGYEEGATKGNIIRALQYMAGKVGKDDVFVFSWQGHGSEVPESETSGENDDFETDRYDEVICPYDCYRDYSNNPWNGELKKYITDDDLDHYFSQIDADGMLLMFESCYSGGLVGNSIGDKIFRNDVDGPGRIVIVSTLDGSLGRASYIFGFPMTWTIGDAFDKNSLLGGPADSGSSLITAEDAFRWARPKIFVENSIFWVGVFAYFFIVEYEFLREEEGFDHEAALQAALESAKWLFFEFCYIQFIFIVSTGGSPIFNWPHMVDGYNPLFGGKELVIVDNAGDVKDKVQVPQMPEIWTKPAYEDFSKDFKRDVSKQEYDQISWYNWQSMDKKSWPPLQAEADYVKDASDKKTVQFTAEASNGPAEFIYYWNFGDGTTSNEQNPTHTYAKDGRYVVTLKVTDSEGRAVEYKIESLKVGESTSKTIQLFSGRLAQLFQRSLIFQNLLSFLL